MLALLPPERLVFERALLEPVRFWRQENIDIWQQLPFAQRRGYSVGTSSRRHLPPRRRFIIR